MWQQTGAGAPSKVHRVIGGQKISKAFGVVAFVTIFLAIFVVITAQKYSVKFSND